MSRDNGRQAEEQERVDRYLAWRRAQGRDRLSRRRPWWGVVAAASLGLAGLGLLAWLTVGPRLESPARPARNAPSWLSSDESGPRAAVRDTPRAIEPPAAAPSPTAPPPPKTAARTPKPSASQLPDRVAPSTVLPPRPPASSPQAPPAQPGPPTAAIPDRPADAVTGTEKPSLAQESVTVLPDPAPDTYDASPATPRDIPPSDGPPQIPSSATGPASAPSPSGPAERTDAPPSPASTAAPADVPPAAPPTPSQPATGPVATSAPETAPRPACGPEVLRRPRTPDGRTRGQAVADCVGGWVKGEVQEFRDGVKREIGEFRTGYDRLRRGLRDLGSRLSGSE
jgi:hypothetical protein